MVGFLFATIRTGGDPVNKLIARLINAGMPREIAVFMCRKFKGRPHDFELYVESIENENKEDYYV